MKDGRHTATRRHPAERRRGHLPAHRHHGPVLPGTRRSPRLRLLEFILAADRTAAECVEQVGITQPRVSVHLSCLADCGYVTARRDGRKLRYSVGDPRVADLVTLARALAADNATALDCCPGIPAPPGTETE